MFLASADTPPRIWGILSTATRYSSLTNKSPLLTVISKADFIVFPFSSILTSGTFSIIPTISSSISGLSFINLGSFTNFTKSTSPFSLMKIRRRSRKLSEYCFKYFEILASNSGAIVFLKYSACEELLTATVLKLYSAS